MSIADKYIVEGGEEGAEGTSKRFVNSKDFDNGMTLLADGMEVFTPEEAKYGVKNEYGAGGVIIKENFFVKKGILKEGESFRYTFKTVEGGEVVFENNSASFYFAFTKVNPDLGDKLSIQRNSISQFEIDWKISQVL